MDRIHYARIKAMHYAAFVESQHPRADSGQFAESESHSESLASGKDTYQFAKSHRDKLESDVKKLGDILKAFPRDTMGLVSESVRSSQEYQQAKKNYDFAFSSLRDFNTQFVKKFAKEIKQGRKMK